MTTTDLRTALHEEAIKAADQFYETAMRLFASQIASVLGAGTPPRKTEPSPQSQSRPRKREKLSQEKLESVLAKVIDLLKRHPGGLRSEQIRTELGLDKKLFQYAANLGKQSDQLVQTGERRATLYLLPAHPSKAQEEGRVIRRKKRA